MSRSMTDTSFAPVMPQHAAGTRLPGVVGADATVHLNPGVGAHRIAHLLQLPNLLHLRHASAHRHAARPAKLHSTAAETLVHSCSFGP